MFGSRRMRVDAVAQPDWSTVGGPAGTPRVVAKAFRRRVALGDVGRAWCGGIACGRWLAMGNTRSTAGAHGWLGRRQAKLRRGATIARGLTLLLVRLVPNKIQMLGRNQEVLGKWKEVGKDMEVNMVAEPGNNPWVWGRAMMRTRVGAAAVRRTREVVSQVESPWRKAIKVARAAPGRQDPQ